MSETEELAEAICKLEPTEKLVLACELYRKRPTVAWSVMKQLATDLVAAHEVAKLKAGDKSVHVALRRLLEVIEHGGGSLALSRGVDLGQASYARKLEDAIEIGRLALRVSP